MGDLWEGFFDNKTDEWLDGYVFAQGNNAVYHWLIRDYESEVDDEHDLVFIFREDVEWDEEE